MTTADGFIEGLCRSYEEYLVAYLTQIVGRPEIARELAQDSCEAIHKTYRPERVIFPRAALFKVATNFALMYLRRRRVERRLLGEAVDMEEVPDEAALPADRQVLAHQVIEHLTATIKELRPSLRSVFVMAHVEGKPRKEIATRLGVSEKRVDKRMTKALSECRRRLIAQGIHMTDVLGLSALLALSCLLGLHR